MPLFKPSKGLSLFERLSKFYSFFRKKPVIVRQVFTTDDSSDTENDEIRRTPCEPILAVAKEGVRGVVSYVTNPESEFYLDSITKRSNKVRYRLYHEKSGKVFSVEEDLFHTLFTLKTTEAKKTPTTA